MQGYSFFKVHKDESLIILLSIQIKPYACMVLFKLTSEEASLKLYVGYPHFHNLLYINKAISAISLPKQSLNNFIELSGR